MSYGALINQYSSWLDREKFVLATLIQKLDFKLLVPADNFILREFAMKRFKRMEMDYDNHECFFCHRDKNLCIQNVQVENLPPDI